MISSSRHRILWFRSNRLSTCCRSWIFLPFCSVLSRHIHSNDYITTRDFRNGVLKRHRQSAIYTRITKVERKHWDGSSDLHITCVVPWQRDDRWWPGGRDPIFENLRSFVVTRKKNATWTSIIISTGDRPSFGAFLFPSHGKWRERGEELRVCVFMSTTDRTFRRPDFVGPRPLAYT